MDIPTRNLGGYIKDKGFNLSEISRKTKLSYMALYDSLLNEDRNRDLRAEEFLTLCMHLGVDPMDFMRTETSMGFADKPEKGV